MNTEQKIKREIESLLSIAEYQGITKRTVDYHVGNLLSKLDVKSRKELFGLTTETALFAS
ncbi:MAG: hypothetical protein APF84_03860 [Gracilibacter sp. BRH_c7a]|nr:MAG: hypothetical protein APF84_03860 [Gracilibacter sp. BRH_c7a]